MLGDNIKRIREKKGIGVNELSRLSGINASYISALERNKKKNPSIGTLESIAKALNVTANDFLTTEDKLSLAMDIISRVKEQSEKALKKTELDLENSIYAITQYFNDDEFTKEEQKEITNFINYVISKREE